MSIVHEFGSKLRKRFADVPASALVAAGFAALLWEIPDAVAATPEEAKAWQEAEFEKGRLRRSLVPSPLPQAGVVEFPSAEPIQVRFRTSDATGGAERIQLDAYPSLRRSAQEGDAVPARTVAEWMAFCGHVRRLPISTEPPYAPYSLAQKPVIASEGMSEAKRRGLEFCNQRTPDEIASALKLFRLAAAGGDVPAMMRLAELTPDKEETLQMLATAWQRGGTLIALSRLSKTYRSRAQESGSGSEDEVRALAARWLYVKLNESAFRQHSVPSEFVDALGKDLARKLDGATPGVRTAAMAKAREMLALNSQCCSLP